MPLLLCELEWSILTDRIRKLAKEGSVKHSVCELEFTKRAQVVHVVGFIGEMVFHEP